VAVAETAREVRSLEVISNRAESVSRLIRKLGKPEQLRIAMKHDLPATRCTGS